MAAEESLSGQQFLYHQSHMDNRTSIEQHGLKASPHEGVVYMSEDPVGPMGLSDDTYRVNTKGLDVVKSGEEGEHWVEGDIPPHHLQRVTEDDLK